MNSYFDFFFTGTTAFTVITLLCGISITRKLSAVHRLVLDTGRPILVWAVSLGLGFQNFQALQIVGFLLMALGVLLFNDILIGKAALTLIFFVWVSSSSLMCLAKA